MSDAYRTAAFACPDCGCSLREFQQRLVCDQCNGMLIRTDDLAAALRELSPDETFTWSDARGDAKPCPRCKGKLALRHGTLGSHAVLDAHVCEAHGAWVTQAALTGAFARTSRRAHRGGGDGQAYGGVAGTPYDPGLGLMGASVAARAVKDAFGPSAPASAMLAISQWHAPRVHTIFVSAYKERTPSCPACRQIALAYAGDRWACPSCAGSFVENAAFVAMVVDIASTPYELPAAQGTRGERECPICAERMLVEPLEGVTIDRCATHGVWFDARELAAALEHAGSHPPHSVGGWLRRLFRRDA